MTDVSTGLGIRTFVPLLVALGRFRRYGFTGWGVALRWALRLWSLHAVDEDALFPLPVTVAMPTAYWYTSHRDGLVRFLGFGFCLFCAVVCLFCFCIVCSQFDTSLGHLERKFN